MTITILVPLVCAVSVIGVPPQSFDELRSPGAPPSPAAIQLEAAVRRLLILIRIGEAAFAILCGSVTLLGFRGRLEKKVLRGFPLD